MDTLFKEMNGLRCGEDDDRVLGRWIEEIETSGF